MAYLICAICNNKLLHVIKTNSMNKNYVDLNFWKIKQHMEIFNALLQKNICYYVIIGTVNTRLHGCGYLS